MAIRWAWLSSRGETGRGSLMITPPASRNHNERQLVDTPTARAAAAPFIPERISSKYRFFTADGILFGAYRGTTTPSGDVRDHRWNSSRVERPVLPLGHGVEDLVGDRGDRLA